MVSGYPPQTNVQGLLHVDVGALEIGEEIFAGSTQDLYLGRAYFQYNRWQSFSNLLFYYMGNDGRGIIADNPPYAGWENGQDPLHSTTGGNMYVECDNTACS
jgi:hypothetical protein